MGEDGPAGNERGKGVADRRDVPPGFDAVEDAGDTALHGGVVFVDDADPAGYGHAESEAVGNLVESAINLSGSDKCLRWDWWVEIACASGGVPES